MSSHLVGIRPPDARFRKMLAVYQACAAASLVPPEEVLAFFDHEKPDKAGVIVELKAHCAVFRYSDDGAEGFDVDLSLLPKDITVLRFYNQW